MKKIITLLGTLTVTTLLCSEIKIDEDRIPNISKDSLDSIVNSPYNVAFDYEENIHEAIMKEKSLSKKKDILKSEATRKKEDKLKESRKLEEEMSKESSFREKEAYNLKDLLMGFEKKEASLNNYKKNIYVAKEKDMEVFLNLKEYTELKGIDEIEDFLNFINMKSGLKLHRKSIVLSESEMITYVGLFFDENISPDLKTYLSFEPKRISSTLDMGTNLDSAFIYYRNYSKIYDKDVYFNLSADEILSLYEKLLRWDVNLKFINRILATSFKAKTSKLKNFNSELAYTMLLKKPSYDLINEIRENLKNTNKSEFYRKTPLAKVNIRNGSSFFSIISDINKEAEKYYTPSFLDTYKTLNIKLHKSKNVNFLSELENDIFVDNETKMTYKLKILSNKFLPYSNKKFTFYKVKNKTQEILHYLNNAIENSEEINNENFSKKLFKDDINEIKKGLL